ncbi:ABC transporter permease [Humibacter ginsenosidimutans]|uniref:ABC transporter permease n=1 Tax=Humibacter ginsenosidimutans TaxID=2599293 RepID=A0A5B8M6Q8_9MICO|nr:ABC transporter permease [Humibacter ginsenosidimutans]QDZ15190.1 ABC transporter permease [Humibacter ginsenosidimutans]
MRYLVRRVIFYAITAWAAITINFFIPRMMPGNPVQSLINKFQGQLSTNAIHSLYVLFGLDKHQSLWEQYWSYWGQLLHGNLGISFAFFPTPVGEVIGQALPWTIGLVGISTIISFVIGTLFGTYIGWRRGTWADGILPVTTFFSSVPYFWLGLIFIAVFAVLLPVFPAGGGYDGSLIPAFNLEFIGSVLQHAALPAITIVLSSVAGWILSQRNMMVTVTSEDYVTVAQAKGLKERTVMFAYAARNAILPQISGFALSLGFVVSGTLVMELVFSYPGIGYQLFQAINAHDYPLMQGIFLVITIAVLVANIIADMVYVFLDPRTRQEG